MDAVANGSVPLKSANFLETLSLIERLHRLLLDVIKDEFERLCWTELNSVQALLLFNIGSEEVTAGDLRSRGYYQGSNVSYNLKKLVEGGYLNHQRCRSDRRAVRISLTDKGEEIRDIVADIFDTHYRRLLEEAFESDDDFMIMNGRMRTLENFWRRSIRFIY
ncbi:MAG: winged helix DNA-binding protein [Pseudomonadota bacterium]